MRLDHLRSVIGRLFPYLLFIALVVALVSISAHPHGVTAIGVFVVIGFAAALFFVAPFALRDASWRTVVRRNGRLSAGFVEAEPIDFRTEEELDSAIDSGRRLLKDEGARHIYGKSLGEVRFVTGWLPVRTMPQDASVGGAPFQCQVVLYGCPAPEPTLFVGVRRRQPSLGRQESSNERLGCLNVATNLRERLSEGLMQAS
jgi:hypothetical protein